jgi:hypothetical protein
MIFLDFLKIPGLTMKERCIFLDEEGKKNNQWILNCIVYFLQAKRYYKKFYSAINKGIIK